MKKILFMTGTRADFGKMKPLMKAVQGMHGFESQIFVTGMHMLSRYGMTVRELTKAGFHNIHTFINQFNGEPMEMTLANTIHGLSRYVHEYRPDLIIVHGDRSEALAGAIVGAIKNILVAHIEGGELSGTIDDLIRHAVSKMSHIHFVANSEAAERLRQMGECAENIYVIGSPDIDVMLSKHLPTLKQAKHYYDIKFDEYAIVMFHPVTTELDRLEENTEILLSALLESDVNYIVIYPNNDEGSDKIFQGYRRLHDNSRFKIFPSLRFEYFLTLLKHSRFLIGNSSAGIREAPVYGVPSINIGSRQQNRFMHDSIIQSEFDSGMIATAIGSACGMQRMPPCHHFGDGNSVSGFVAAITSESLWRTPKQKHFRQFLAEVTP